MDDPGRTLILGAGPTGLGAASRFEELGFGDFLLLCADAHAGGLAASEVDARGFTWDLGGHVQFSHYPHYDAMLDRVLPGQWLWHERESWVWFRGRFVPYPFQNNLHRLDPADRDRALEGLRRAAAARASAPAPEDFRRWLAWTFGEELCALFLYPYNLKVWGYPLEELSVGWMGDRVAVPDLARVERNLREARDDVSWGPNNRFRFPLRGGTGAIWSSLAAQLHPGRLRWSQRVQAIDLTARTVTLEAGETLPFDTLISSAPLDWLVRHCAGLSPDSRRAAEQLLHSTVHILGVGLFGERPEALRTKCWMYFPEGNSPYYRVTVFSNYSPHHVPDPRTHWSLMAEVCDTPGKPVDPAKLEGWTLAALREDGLIPPGARVESVWARRLPHGYPTPSLHRDEALACILPELERHRVFSRGRFGAWKYEVSNQDHSFMQGVELADRLLRGEPEVTLPHPNRVNAPRS